MEIQKSLQICSQCGYSLDLLSRHPQVRAPSELVAYTRASNCNDPLPEDAASEVRRDLSTFECSIALLDEELDRLRSLRTNIQTVRGELRLRAQSLKTLLHPLRGISADILSLIFSACIEYDVPPLTLTAVCQPWREAALRTPQLWRKLDVKMSKNVDDATFKWMEGWIARSGALPLDIYAVEEDIEGDERPASALVSAGERWQDVALTLTRSMCHQLITARPSFPLLQSLDLYIPPFEDFHEEMSSSIRAFEHARKLHVLSLSFFTGHTSVRALWPVSDLSFLWTRLTSLTLTNSDTQFLDALASSARSLEVLYIKEMNLIIPSKSIIFVRVRDLSLVNILVPLYKLINELTLPELQDLTLACTNSNTSHEYISRALPELCRRSRCQVKRLHIRGLDGVATNLVHVLMDMPYLETLIVDSATGWQMSPRYPTPDPMHRLIVTNNATVLAPRLKHFDVSGRDIDMRNFVRVLQSRSQSFGHEQEVRDGGVTRLQTASLSCNGSYMMSWDDIDEMIGNLRQMREAGLRVSVTLMGRPLL